MPASRASRLQGTSCIIEKIPFYLRYSKPDICDRYIPQREEYTLERNKKQYFRVGKPAYHIHLGQGIVVAKNEAKDIITVSFDNKKIDFKISSITEDQSLKPYNKF